MVKKVKKVKKTSGLNLTGNPINDLDIKISKFVYDLFNTPTMSLIPNYLGLIPYELYVLPCF